jgi:uncharacterized membrane-anchored protein YhcB (DUF1043 family)
MTKNAIQKGKAQNGAAADGAAEVPESLEQVRDILFGGQMRMVDTRLRGLEERFQHELSALRTDFTRQMSDADGATKKELGTLVERLNAERAKRAEDLKSIGTEFKEALKSLERRHQKLEEAASHADADLRDQLMKATAALSAEMARTAERLTNDLERAATALRSDKLDTAALASALTNMAAGLTGPGRATGKGTPRT